MSARMNRAARVGNPQRLAQEGGLLGVALDQMDHRAGVSANAQASTTPGKPPPLPRSAQALADGRERQKLQRIGDMPGPQMSAASRARRDWSWPATPAAARHSGPAAPLFHVKQASAPAPRLCRRRGSASGWFAGRIDFRIVVMLEAREAATRASFRRATRLRMTAALSGFTASQRTQ